MLIARVRVGMSRHGVRVVSARLSDVPGVLSVEVDAAAGLVAVGGVAHPGQIGAALAEVGYPAESISVRGHAEPPTGQLG